MQSKEILRTAMKTKKVTQKELAESIGLKNQQAIGNLLNRSNGMLLNGFVEMLNKMGYEVIVREKKEIGEIVEWEVEI